MATFLYCNVVERDGAAVALLLELGVGLENKKGFIRCTISQPRHSQGKVITMKASFLFRDLSTHSGYCNYCNILSRHHLLGQSRLSLPMRYLCLHLHKRALYQYGILYFFRV